MDKSETVKELIADAMAKRRAKRDEFLAAKKLLSPEDLAKMQANAIAKRVEKPRKLTNIEKKEIFKIKSEGINNAEIKARKYIASANAYDFAFATSINSGFSPLSSPGILKPKNIRRIKERIEIEKSTPEWRLSELSRIQEALSKGSFDKGTINWLLRDEERLKKMIEDDIKEYNKKRILGEEHQLKHNEGMFRDRIYEKDRIESIWKAIDPLVMEDIERRYASVNQILDEKQMRKNRGNRVSVYPGEFSELFHITSNQSGPDYIERFKTLSIPYYEKAIKRINSMQNGGKRNNKTHRKNKKNSRTRRM